MAILIRLTKINVIVVIIVVVFKFSLIKVKKCPNSYRNIFFIYNEMK